MTTDAELNYEMEDDDAAIVFIRKYLPQGMKDIFTDDELVYIMDLIAEYFYSSGVLDDEGDDDGCIDIDIAAIAEFIVKEAKHDKMGPFDLEAVSFVVEAELEYSNSLEDEE